MMILKYSISILYLIDLDIFYLKDYFISKGWNLIETSDNILI